MSAGSKNNRNCTKKKANQTFQKCGDSVLRTFTNITTEKAWIELFPSHSAQKQTSIPYHTWSLSGQELYPTDWSIHIVIMQSLQWFVPLIYYHLSSTVKKENSIPDLFTVQKWLLGALSSIGIYRWIYERNFRVQIFKHRPQFLDYPRRNWKNFTRHVSETKRKRTKIVYVY